VLSMTDCMCRAGVVFLAAAFLRGPPSTPLKATGSVPLFFCFVGVADAIERPTAASFRPFANRKGPRWVAVSQKTSAGGVQPHAGNINLDAKKAGWSLLGGL